MEDNTPNGVSKAVSAAGSQAKLAEQLGCTQQAVSGWVLRGFVPPLRAVEIEAVLGIPRKELLSPRLASIVNGGTGKLGRDMVDLWCRPRSLGPLRPGPRTG